MKRPVQARVAAGTAEAEDDGPVAEEDESPFVCVQPHGLIEVIATGTVVSRADSFQLGELFEHARP